MTAQLSVLIALLLATACSVLADHEPATSLFQVLVSPWSSCSRINETQVCYRTRQIVCVRISDNVTAPWYYCNATERYATVEACPQGSCLQNCAVSEWGAWSPCNCSLHLFSNRSRSVVSPPRNGGQPCPGLLERSVCGCARHLPFDSQPRRYTWRTGSWRECRAQDARSGCGNGLRNRSVECVDIDGSTVLPGKCLQELPYSNLHPPSPEMLCEIPCPCLLGDWESYSPCTPLCDAQPLRGERTRTRQILRSPTLGLSCDAVEQTEACQVSTDGCPAYVWETSGWSPCIFPTGATCGAGHMTRYAYCTEVQDGVRRSGVDEAKCQHFADNTTKPALLQSCRVDCPQPCQVGEWSDWTDCPRSCQETYSNRTRRIIVPPLEGEVCPHTVEFRPCPVLACARYLAGTILFGCLRFEPPGCGEGTVSRSISCVDPNDQELDLTACSHLEYPLVSTPCIIPCPDDCVVSDWSEWSPCSETCGGRIGNQTRSRHFVAYGSSCPYTDSNLTETRLCSEAKECELTRFYFHEEPWGACVAGEDPMQSSALPPESGILQSDESGVSGCVGSGIRNRTRLCVRNDQIIPATDCPLVFQPVQLETCELPCPVECVLSEWSPYSACSASCGTGTKYRTRRLLQFPTSDLSECGASEDDLSVDGLIVESAMCEVEACEETRIVTWYETGWSSCILYNTVSSSVIGNLEPGSCGLGFENRTVACMEVGTGFMVSDSQCYNTIGPHPSMIRGCHLQCADRCLVTEWSEFTTCEFGGITETHREVVPRRGCNQLQDCCPELSSIKTLQSLPCPTFQPHCYNFVESSPFGQCILESPLDTCGNGKQYRNIVCLDLCTSRVRGENVVVNSSFCILAGRPTTASLTAPCAIRCQRNCMQSKWSDWGPCSTTCGSGTRTRTRDTTSRGEEGGRPCGPEVETDICVGEMSCPYTEVTPGSFGPCVLTNTTSLCGPGQRTRQPLCFVNGEPRDYSVCLDMGVTASFNLTESCVSDCPGECVAGEWGEWSPCNTNCPPGGCQRHRERKILREGDGDCMKMTQEFQICSSPEIPYRWMSLPWMDCVVGSSSVADTDVASRGHYCGEGVHSRIVRCEATSASVVPDHLCTDAGLTKPSVMESCSVPCPIDCLVGAFSDWTECEPCVYNSHQQRVRRVIVANTFGGEECPDLEQTRSCVPTNCIVSDHVTNTFIATDYTMDSQCGSALVLQPVSCRSNTVFMSPSECRASGDEPQEMHEDLPCPLEPNCTFGEWSDWSECLSLCHTPGVRFSFRIRQLVSSLPGLASACETQQHQQRECTPEQTSENGTDLIVPTSMLGCVDFTWQVSEWDQNGRNVYCLSNSGTRVENSGCPQSNMPRSQNETCVGMTCPSHATCINEEGVSECVCNDISDKVQGVCLPRVGCFGDDHCLLQNMQCNTRGGCECVEGYDIMHSNGYCVPVIPTVTAPTDPVESTDPGDLTDSTDPTNLTEPTDSTPSGPVDPTTSDVGVVADTTAVTTAVETTTNQPAVENGLGVIPLALIGAVPLFIFIIVIICLIIIMYRCRKNLEHKHTTTEMKRRRIKASISSPSPTPQTTEEMMHRVRGDSGSSGFVDGGIDADLHKYGLAATTFVGPHGDNHIDEPVADQYSPEYHRSVAVHPIPIAAPIPPIRHYSLHREEEEEFRHRGEDPSRTSSLEYSLRSSDQVPRRYQIPHLTDFPDGGVATDMTYTTDEDTVGTTSFPPSSTGSPSMARRPLPHHMYPTEPGYRDYSHSNNNHHHGSHDSGDHGHIIVPASQCHHDHGHHSSHDHVHDHHDRVHDHHDRVHDHHDHTHDNHDHIHDNQESITASTENPYVSMNRMSPVYARVRRGQYRSTSPPTSPVHDARNESPRHMTMQPGERDGRIAVGLDSSMLRAVTQLGRQSPTSVHSSQSHARRRSGRRRRHMRAPRYHHHSEGRYPHDSYHHSDGHLRSDGHYSSDHYSTSDAEYPSKSEPRTPTHQIPPGDGYESRTLPHVHFSNSHPHSRHHGERQAREYYPGDGDYHQHHSPTHKDSYHRWYHGEQPAESHGREDYYVEHYPPQRRHASPQRHHTSPQRRNVSPQRYQASPQRRHTSPQRHHTSPQRYTPPPSPRDPPNFVPPVPPHSLSPAGDGFDDYDYPSRYQPHQLQKLKEEAERERNSPYSRPRPLNSPGSKEQVSGEGRTSSPYDHPKIRSAVSGASHTHPYSPSMTSDPSTSFSSPRTSYSSPQISRAASQGGSLTPQNRHSNPGLPKHLEMTNSENVPPQSSISAPQPSTSTPQPSTSDMSQLGTYLGIEFSDPTPLPGGTATSTFTAQPTTSTPTPQPNEAVPQPNTSTPQRVTKANLTIQISPVSEQGKVSEQGNSSLQGSPFLSRRHHLPSPLLHSSSVSDESPRTSGDADALGYPRSSGDIDTFGARNTTLPVQ